MPTQKNITVGDMYKTLKDFPPETEITFGSSTFSKRPLAFNRFKKRGEKLLHIELVEMLEDVDNPEFHYRITVGEILNTLRSYRDSDEVTFGSTIDAVPLNLHSISSAVSINLEQVDPPELRLSKSK